MKTFYTSFLLITWLLIFKIGFSQVELDSLKLATIQGSDSAKILTMVKLVNKIMYSDIDEAQLWTNKILELSKKNQWPMYEAKAYIDLGIFDFEKGKFDKAIEQYQKALNVAINAKDTVMQARCYGNIGNASMSLARYEQAINNFQKALNIFELKNNKKGIASSNGAIGNLYLYLSDYKKAKPYYQKSNALYSELKNDFGTATTLMNLGLIKKFEQDYEQAIIDFKKSADLFRICNSPKYQGQALANAGNCYSNLKNSKQAFKNLISARDLFFESEALEDIVSVYSDIGNVYLWLKNYDQAIFNYELALKYADSIQTISQKELIYNNLKKCYENIGNFKLAYYASLNHAKYSDSLINIEQIKEREKLFAQFETERKEKEITILNKEGELQKIKIEDQKNQMYFMIIGLVLMLGLVFSFFSMYKIKQRSNEYLKITNSEIMQQKEEILAQRDEIESQRNEINRRNQLIFQSLRYAKTIQSSIIPDESILKTYFADAFVYLRPKDVVSGDFYWLERQNNIVYLAVIDCTGHGVPGAFMTLVAYNLFNQAIYEMESPKPSAILQFVNAHFIMNYGKYQSEILEEEGMELTLAAFDMESLNMTYAGNGGLMIHFAANEYITIKTPKVLFGHKGLKFDDFAMKLNRTDKLFFYTDGYQDQFGDIERKKFKSANFIKLLQQLSGSDFKIAKESLEQRFMEYAGNSEQIDDILVVGIEV